MTSFIHFVFREPGKGLESGYLLTVMVDETGKDAKSRRHTYERPISASP
jgi:hypothetical protein